MGVLLRFLRLLDTYASKIAKKKAALWSIGQKDQYVLRLQFFAIFEAYVSSNLKLTAEGFGQRMNTKMEESNILFYTDLVIMTISGFLAFAGNLPVILTFMRYKKARNNTTRPLVSLACADILIILYVALYVPLQITHGQYAIAGLSMNNTTDTYNKSVLKHEMHVDTHRIHLYKEFQFDIHQTTKENISASQNFQTWSMLCRISKALSIFITGCDCVNAVLILIENYISMRYPLRYNSLITDMGMKIAICIIWIICIIRILPQFAIEDTLKMGDQCIRMDMFRDWEVCRAAITTVIAIIIFAALYGKIFLLQREKAKAWSQLSKGMAMISPARPISCEAGDTMHGNSDHGYNSNNSIHGYSNNIVNGNNNIHGNSNNMISPARPITCEAGDTIQNNSIHGYSNNNSNGNNINLSYNTNHGNINQGNVNHGNVNHGNVNHGNVNHGNINHGNINHGNNIVHVNNIHIHNANNGNSNNSNNHICQNTVQSVVEESSEMSTTNNGSLPNHHITRLMDQRVNVLTFPSMWLIFIACPFTLVVKYTVNQHVILYKILRKVAMWVSTFTYYTNPVFYSWKQKDMKKKIRLLVRKDVRVREVHGRAVQESDIQRTSSNIDRERHGIDHPGLSEIPAPAGGPGSDIIN